MKETLLIYHIEEKVEQAIRAIMAQLDVDVQVIKDEDIYQKMGYILGLNGYTREENESNEKLDKSFLYFAFFLDEQIDIVLEVFKMANIPYIPYKAMFTHDNVNYTFNELYKNVEHEYQSLTNTIDK